MQLSLFDFPEPSAPEPVDPHAGEICACGWLMAALHINVVDRPGWRVVRHLWLWLPEDA